MADDAVLALARKRRGEVRHTKEIQREHLPDDVQALILDMAGQIGALNLKVAGLESDVSGQRANIVQLQADLAAVQSVTLNDLMRRAG